MLVSGTRSRIRLDFTLLAVVLALIGIGQLALHSASDETSTWQLTQLGWLAFGTIAAVLVAVIDFRTYERFAYIFYGGVVAMLVAALFIGVEKNNASRWLDLGVFEAQPSELMKVGVILVIARFLRQRSIPGGYRLRDLVKPFGLMAGPAVLVALQPDLGTALVICFIGMTMLLFEGIRRSSIIALVLGAILIAVPFWTFGMHPYQRERVTSFLDPEGLDHASAWQVRQSIIAVGSGGLGGLGHGAGSQVQHDYVPEDQNDFIFAHVGEEYGFIGGTLVISLYGLLILWSLRIARYSRDKFGVLLAVGIGALFFWHVIVNLGMVLGMLPVVGLWLPFLSQGGSSTLTVMICIGLLMNLSVRRHVFQR